MRTPQETDYTVPVASIGTFTFGKRTMRDEIAVQVEYARIIDGVIATAWLQAVAGWISPLRVLTVRAPAGWDVDELDPTDPATYAKMQAVYGALSEKETSFRRKPKSAVEGDGAVQA